MVDLKLMIEYTKNLNVLYVEDDIGLVESTKELFKNFFKNIDISYDGEDGLKKYLSYYNDNNRYYDLVITDISMPKMSGLEMSSEILKKNSMQSIVITSAHNEIQELSQAIDLGISGFVTKPLNNTQLTKVLYKSAQAISDHKFVEEHVEQIEELNMELEKRNRELITKNTELEKSFRMLDTMVHKEKLNNSLKEDEPPTLNNEEDIHIQEQIQHLICDDLDELKEIHSDIDLNIINIINSIDSIDEVALESAIQQFLRYASILSFYNFFDELSSAMSKFASTLKENPLPDDKESIENIFMLLESFMYVLGKWQDDLASGNESKINSLDASIISDMNTITNMWIAKEEVFREDDLDNIFDF